MIETGRLKKRFSAAAGKILTGLGLLASSGGFLALMVFAFRWADVTDHFHIKGIEVAGNYSLDKKELIDMLQIWDSASLPRIDPVQLQERLEDHPYVKAARVSKNYPSTLSIDIVERTPIAYVNHAPFLMVDGDGVVLPLSKGEFEFDIPTLSGFNPAPELYPNGQKCLSRKVLETVAFLNSVRREFPRLYGDISEVKIDASDEYVLFLAQYPTKILMGSSPSAPEIRLLRQFSDTITGARTLHDYTYVDLRYKKQIVVREKT